MEKIPRGLSRRCTQDFDRPPSLQVRRGSSSRSYYESGSECSFITAPGPKAEARLKSKKKRTPKPHLQLVEAEYLKLSPLLKRLEDEALFIVNEALGKSNVRIHSVSSRIKTFKSFAEKAERNQLTEPYLQIRDVVGIRIVCLFISDIERIGKLISEAFDVLEEDNKIDGGEVSSFGYMSFHFIVKMKSTYAGPRYDDIAQRPFEIQVRTIAMDAWAAASHYLDYKTEVDVPSDLRRDFFALSGLFYVADRHFEMFFNARRSAIAEITSTLKQPSPIWDQELNLDSLRAYLKLTFPDRTQPDGPDTSSLVDDLRQRGISSIKEVKQMVDQNYSWFVGREKRHPPGPTPRKGARFQAVGVVRIILNERYKNKVGQDILHRAVQESAKNKSD